MKKPLVIRALVIGFCASALLVLVWSNWSPTAQPGSSVKRLAIKAASGDPAAMVALKALGTKAVPGLVDLMGYQDPFWRRMAWKSVPKLPKWLGQTLLARMEPTNAPRTRVAGAKGLALLGPQAEEAVPALVRVLHDPEPYIAAEAGTALARIGKASVPALTMALTDKTSLVRHTAAYALGEIGPDAEPALPDLIEILQDSDPTVRFSTAYSLALIGVPAIAAISNVIDHADADARELALRQLIRFFHALRSVTPPLNKMAHALEPASRRRALEALMAVRAVDDMTVRTFIDSLEDPDAEVRLAAVNALGLVPWRAQSAVGGLAKCLRDPSVVVRERAARALGGIGPPARPALLDLEASLHDNDNSVRAAAQVAVQKIHEDEPAKDLSR